MKINLLAKNLELTDQIRDYVMKKVTNLEKLLYSIKEKGGEVMANFEVGKTTNHHKSGKVFRAECLIKIDGEDFYASAETDDLFAAIDEVKENIFREISKFKNKKRKIFHRGARKVKEVIKGLRNFRK